MNISALHAQVRGLVQGIPIATTPQDDGANPGQLSAAERLALRSFQHNLERVGGEIARLEAVGGTFYWMAPTRQQTVG